MTDRNRHQELLDYYDDATAKEARESTLDIVSFNRMQSLASEVGVCEQGDTAQDLRERLAGEGYFVGAIGDPNVYRVDSEGEVEKVASNLD